MLRSALLVSTLFPLAAFAADPPQRQDNALKVGAAAPTFELKKLGSEESVKLASLNDKPVVLIFGSCT